MSLRIQLQSLKPSNVYDADKMIKEKNDSFNQLNLDEDLPTRITLPAALEETHLGAVRGLL